MKKTSFMVAGVLAALATSAFAQNLVEGVTESTDPAKAAAVEQHANELKSQAQNSQATQQSRMRHQGDKHHAQHRAKKQSSDKTDKTDTGK